MPTYEYECQKCKDKFENFQSMSSDPLKRCKECGGKLKRLIGTGAGIIFKGSGFYATDYRSSDYKSKEKAEKTSVCTSSKNNCSSCPLKKDKKSVSKD
ncbi:MAG: zinc ribbon domain-containing protein [Candidatus Omnitrophica bacterium]|nr:zinc ribbon domain-containing protein [Candidatus Omnitrophota bacterium]